MKVRSELQLSKLRHTSHALNKNNMLIMRNAGCPQSNTGWFCDPSLRQCYSDDNLCCLNLFRSKIFTMQIPRCFPSSITLSRPFINIYTYTFPSASDVRKDARPCSIIVFMAYNSEGPSLFLETLCLNKLMVSVIGDDGNRSLFS